MSDIKTFLMMGPPGSGKGTQAKLLAKKINAEIYSTGNRFREMAKGQDFLSQKVKKNIDEGVLLPAWFSSHLFVDTLLGLAPGDPIVFEGACRRLEEARAFDETVAWLERPYRAVFLNISDAEVEKRLSLRKGTEGRADDASDTVPHRIKEFEENTLPAIAFFKSQGALLEVSGEQPVEAVHADVLKVLGF